MSTELSDIIGDEPSVKSVIAFFQKSMGYTKENKPALWKQSQEVKTYKGAFEYMVLTFSAATQNPEPLDKLSADGKAWEDIDESHITSFLNNYIVKK